MSSPRFTPRTALALTLMLAVPALSGCIATAGAVGANAMETRSTGAMLDDTSLQTKLNIALLQELPNFSTNVGTEVHEGRVLIVGSVRTPEEKIAASRAAWNINGVREVINELDVRQPQGFSAYAKDARISNQLRAKMLFASGVSEFNYSIETLNSTVYILGVAQSRQELEKVAGLAATVAGVERVVSHALLRDDARRLRRPAKATATTTEM